MATAEIDQSDHGHDDEHHGPSWLAHHFDTPEQQFDSGKLGMWLFLVTEILFFSGLFCAYAIYRSLRPEVYTFASQFLNTELGAINTGVLLFSSLTMAWAVRASQLEQHKTTVGMIAATLGCAMIFLGVKAVEYSHKWNMGLLPAGWYNYDPTAAHGEEPYLFMLSVVPGLLVVGLVLLYIYGKVASEFVARCALPLAIAAACYFVGIGLGVYLESKHAAAHGSHAAVAADGDHAPEHAAGEGSEGEQTHVAVHDASESSEEVTNAAIAATEPEEVEGVVGLLASDSKNTGVLADLEARRAQEAMASGTFVESISEDHVDPFYEKAEMDVNSNSLAGVFFSIYYCMTGLHAIHIIIGIGVLSWLLVRSVREDFNRHYFGPVDYVGLYWHIVDLIWIYLFPLLYLIG